MKKTFTFILISLCALSFSQVAIGKSDISKLSDGVTTNPGISLEFGTGGKGVVLPWVNGTSNSSPFITGYTGTETVVDGTIVYDVSDKKVKYKKGGNWFDLSVDTTGAVFTSAQDTLDEISSAKVAIGMNGATDTTPGILVLTDTNKAMVLPKMASPHLNIKNPSAGMMAYDTTAHQLTVFNGSVWTFWKP